MSIAPLQATKTGPKFSDIPKVVVIVKNALYWHNLIGNEFYNYEKGYAFVIAVTNVTILAMKWFPDLAFIEPMDPWDRAQLLL